MVSESKDDHFQNTVEVGAAIKHCSLHYTACRSHEIKSVANCVSPKDFVILVAGISSLLMGPSDNSGQ